MRYPLCEGFGYFGGLGYDLVSVEAGPDGSNSSNGLMLDAGVRFSVKIPLSVRVSYLISSKSGDSGASNVLGPGVSYMFGMSSN